MKTLGALSVLYLSVLISRSLSQPRPGCPDPIYSEECARAYAALDIPSHLNSSSITAFPSNLDDLLEIACQTECAAPYIRFLQCYISQQEFVNLYPGFSRLENASAVLNSLLCGQSDDQFCVSLFANVDEDIVPQVPSGNGEAGGSASGTGGTSAPSGCNPSTGNCSSDCQELVDALLDHFGCCFELIDPLIQAGVDYALRISSEPVGNIAAICRENIPASCELVSEGLISGSSIVAAAMSVTAFVAFLTTLIGTL